ncbi:RHS repeat-associated core domain-containing protein [Agromyces italicus]|uniref:RHS repeat-associated core domain-containing protein n=1 Tax=Agromyces italicus TaxID=279572 RepID=UPI0003B57509|nr:RHS repeat-associated core domain-containing protein [Agromyces italicus]
MTRLGAREYDPVLGKFLTVDPILVAGDRQQGNAYSYSGNNPVMFEDASGLCALGADDYTDVCGNQKLTNPNTAGGGTTTSYKPPAAGDGDGGDGDPWLPWEWSEDQWQDAGAIAGGIVVGVVIGAAVGACVVATAGIGAAAGAGFFIAGMAVAGATSSAMTYHWSSGEKTADGFVRVRDRRRRRN